MPDSGAANASLAIGLTSRQRTRFKSGLGMREKAHQAFSVFFRAGREDQDRNQLPLTSQGEALNDAAHEWGRQASAGARCRQAVIGCGIRCHTSPGRRLCIRTVQDILEHTDGRTTMINVDLHITPMLCRGYQWYVVESKRNSSKTCYPVFACYAGQ
jgi:hypothetical protein